MFPGPNFGDLFNDSQQKLLAYCPVCRTKYDFFQAKIIEEREESYLVFIQCKKCRSGIVALLLNNMYGISSIGLVTDLSYEDAVKFIKDRNCDYDDVIEIHKLLGRKRGLLKQIK